MSRFLAGLVLAVLLAIPMATETLGEESLQPSDPHNGPWLDPHGWQSDPHSGPWLDPDGWQSDPQNGPWLDPDG